MYQVVTSLAYRTDALLMTSHLPLYMFTKLKYSNRKVVSTRIPVESDTLCSEVLFLPSCRRRRRQQQGDPKSLRAAARRRAAARKAATPARARRRVRKKRTKMKTKKKKRKGRTSRFL